MHYRIVDLLRTVHMPAYAADLHNHTPASADHHEPDTSPRDIVESALDAGLHVYAATDHFACGFATDLVVAADQVAAETGRRLLVVPGAELRITHRGDESHIIALFDPRRHEASFSALLEVLGLTQPCAAHEDLPFFTHEHDPVEVCRIIDALGGVACVAHVDRTFGGYRLIDTQTFWRLVAEPTVSAVDFLDPVAHADITARLRPGVIRCSDSHSCDTIGLRRSLVAMEDLSFPSLRAALKAGAVVPEVLV